MIGYVYSLWSGRFLCKECEIETTIRRESDGQTLARATNGTLTIIDPTPGVIYNGMVWFEERDDERAAAILIEYQKKQIVKLEERIGNCKYKIQTLLNGIKEV